MYLYQLLRRSHPISPMQAPIHSGYCGHNCCMPGYARANELMYHRIGALQIFPLRASSRALHQSIAAHPVHLLLFEVIGES